jgi:glucan phosphorylase
MLGRCIKEFYARDGELPQAYHLNEGHVANVLVAMDEIDNMGQRGKIYINHSPVREANETFVISALDGGVPDRIRYQGFPHSRRWLDFWNQFTTPDGKIDMSLGAQHLSDETVAVSSEHAGTVQALFPEYKKRVIPVLNGSGDDWVMPETLEWRNKGIMPPAETRRAIHRKGKEAAHRLIKERTKDVENSQGRRINENGVELKMDEPTVWLARRIAKYKSMYPILRRIIRIVCADRGQVFDTPRGPKRGLAMQVVVGGSAASKRTQAWIEQVVKWMERPELKGRFVFVPGGGRELLKAKAVGADICVSTPLQGKEACGTSDQRSNLNVDSITVSVDTGGPHDYIKDGENSFLIGPYKSDKEFFKNAPWDLLDRLTAASDMYYSRQETGDTRWDEMAERAHRTANEAVTAEAMAKRYATNVYEPVFREKGMIALENEVRQETLAQEAALSGI